MIALDTHVVIWAVTDTPRLSREAERALRRQRALVPAICLWELAMLLTRGRLGANPGQFGDYVNAIAAGPNIRIQELTPEISLRAAQLSLNQPMDPADQLIAATALELRVPLVSADERLHGIPGLEVIW